MEESQADLDSYCIIVSSEEEDLEEEAIDLTQISDEEEEKGEPENDNIAAVEVLAPPTPHGWTRHFSTTFSRYYFWDPRTNATSWTGQSDNVTDTFIAPRQPLPAQSELFTAYRGEAANHPVRQHPLQRLTDGHAQRSNGDNQDYKIFIGGLGGISDTDVQRQQLRNYFAQFGKLLQFRVMIDKITKQSRGFAFGTYLTRHSAERACSEGIIVDGSRVTVTMSISKEADGVGGSKRMGKKVFIGGISGLSRSILEGYFGTFGSIEKLEIPGEGNAGGSRGFGFVHFFKQTAAAACISTVMHDICGRRVEVKLAIPKAAIEPGSRMASADPIRQRTVFVGNLGWEVKEDQLRLAFGQFGEIRRVNIRQKFRDMLDRNGQRLHAAPNIAHIEFASIDTVERVVNVATSATTDGLFQKLAQKGGQRLGLRIDRAGGPAVLDS